MSRKISAIAIIGFALLVVLGTVHQAMAQAAATPAPATPYSKMAPIDQYLMADRAAEIALARKLRKTGLNLALVGVHVRDSLAQVGGAVPTNGMDAPRLRSLLLAERESQRHVTNKPVSRIASTRPDWQMINFRVGVFGRTIQKLRQIVVFLAMRRFISPAGNLLNSFL